MADNINIQTISADVKFPEFDINDFYEDFKDWQVENHMGLFGRPVKPVKPIQRQSIAEQMEGMPEPPVKPVMETTPERPKKPVDDCAAYTSGHLRRETIKLLCPRPRRPIASYKFESSKVHMQCLRDFDMTFKYHLEKGPGVLLSEYKEVLGEIAYSETSDNYFVFWELNKYLKELTYFVHNLEDILRGYADKLYNEKMKQYEQELEYYHEHSPQKNSERYERAIEQYYNDYKAYARIADEFRRNLEWGGRVSDEYYQDSLQIYNDNMWKYKEKKHLYGPEKLTVEDFLLTTYVYPDIKSKYIFLKDGRTYEVPEYIRGNKVSDLKFTQKWNGHLEAYRKFLLMNPHISQRTIGKYYVRTVDPKWNFKTFMKAWVLSYYTELYDDLSIKFEDV